MTDSSPDMDSYCVMFVARYVSTPTCSTIHCVAAHRNTRTNSAFSAPNSAAISLTLITAPSRLVSSLHSPRSIPTYTMLGGSAQKIKRCVVSHGCSSLREATLAASRNRSRFPRCHGGGQECRRRRAIRESQGHYRLRHPLQCLHSRVRTSMVWRTWL